MPGFPVLPSRPRRWLGLACGAGLALAAAAAQAEPKFVEKSQPAAASAGTPPAPAGASQGSPSPGPSQGAAPAQGYREEAEFGGHEINLLGGGTELEFTGALTASGVRDLQETLDRNPGLRVLQLTSQGGISEPSMRLAETLRRRGIVTYVPTYCASACTYIFLGGRERYVAPQARLGFHQAASVRGSGQDDPKFNAEVAQWLVGLGVDRIFADKVAATPHSAMWQPDAVTLQKAGVITGVSRPGQFASPSFGQGAAAAVDKMMLNRPLFAALRKASPGAYEATRSELAMATSEVNDGSEDAAFASSYFAEAFDRAATIASDQSLIDYTAALVETLEQLNPRSGTLCMMAAGGRPLPPLEVRRILPDALVQRRIQTAAAVLESSAASPQPAPLHEVAKQAFRNLLMGMRGTLRDEWQYLAHPEQNPRRACSLYKELYQEALEADAGQRSILLRALLGHLL
ncbi:MAG: hypothetical protein U1E53_03005 [Dongiaceae bacterium]